MKNMSNSVDRIKKFKTLNYIIKLTEKALVNIESTHTEAKKQKTHLRRCVLFDVGVDLFFREAALQVSSARVSLTTVFGMGTGGPSA